MRIEINYLADFEVATGNLYNSQEYPGWWGRIEIRKIPTTIIEMELPPEVPQIYVGWGDYGYTPDDLAIWARDPTTKGDVILAIRKNDKDRLHAETTEADWLTPDLKKQIVSTIKAKALEAAEKNPDIQKAVAFYAALWENMNKEYKDHIAGCEAGNTAIAKKFHRKHVEVGEQTVPGLCVVRSSRGKTLGYASMQDGRWTGKIQRA